jgi:DNA-directed RNA polymerase specialized sigma subunit
MTKNKAELGGDVAEATPEDIAVLIDSDAWHAPNARLRREYLELQQAVRDTQDPKEEAKLIRKLSAVSGAVVSNNLGLAGCIWRRYIGGANREHIADFKAVAVMGLWIAFQTWDPDKGTLGTWSKKQIFGLVAREVAFQEKPWLTYHEDGRAQTAQREHDRILTATGVAPTDEEVAELLGVTVALLQASRRPGYMYLDAPLGDGEGTVADTISVTDRHYDDDTDIVDGLFTSLTGAKRSDDELTKVFHGLTPLEMILVLNHTGLVYGGLDIARTLTLADGADKWNIGREILRRQLERASVKVDEAVGELAELARARR